MIWFARRPACPIRRAPKRRVLRLDCLEDRFAPAGLGVFDSAAAGALPIAPRANDLDFLPAARVAINDGASAAAPSEIAIGFFHPFCLNGFQSGEMIALETPAPLPRPVTPPALPTAAATPRNPLPQPATLILDPLADPLEAPMALPRPTANEATAPAPDKIESTPRAINEPVPTTASVSPRRSSTPSTEITVDTVGYVVPATRPNQPPRKSFAAVGGLLAAAGFLYLRNPGERRREGTL